MFVLHLLAWFPMVVIAIVNGAIREGTYGKRIPELAAHQLSTLSGIVLFALYTWGLSCMWPLQSGAEAAAVGTVWLVLTLAFEFLFGHYVAGHSWARILADYNILKGRVWVFIPAWVAVAPYVFYRLHAVAR